MKIVISNPENGKSYQKELEATQAKTLFGKKLKETVNGDAIGMMGYELIITGGSDKQGFPMRADLHGTSRKKLLLTGGTGYKPKEKGIRRRKSVRGNTVSEEIAQVNLKVVKAGKDALDKILGKAEDKPKEEAKAEEKPKAEAKPKEEAKKEEPKEEKKETPKEEKKE
jgi:small subunit ribosomal protein S6e